MRRLLGVAAAVVSVLALVAACSGADAFPTGKWTATNESGVVGVMDFRTDGTWVFTAAGSQVNEGTYSTDKTTLTIKTDRLCKSLGGEQATYSWTHANDQLTLKKQTDPCTDRVGVLDGRAWTPAK